MTAAPQSASAPKPKRAFSPRRRAAIRLAELRRLADRRTAKGTDLGPWQAWATAFAQAAVCLGVEDVLADLRARCPVEIGSVRETRKLIVNVRRQIERRNFEGFGPDSVGALLEVTSAEADAYRLRTIFGADETRAHRINRKYDARCEKQRIAAAAKRRAAGKKPRQEFIETSAEAAKPWLAAGVSRRTWYRRNQNPKARGTGPSPYGDICPSGDGVVPHVAPTLTAAPKAAASHPRAESTTAARGLLFQIAADRLRAPLFPNQQRAGALKARPAARRY